MTRPDPVAHNSASARTPFDRDFSHLFEAEARMNHFKWGKRILAAMTMTFMAIPSLAIETGDMPLEPGFEDPKTGVRIEEIVISPKEDVQAVHLSVPAGAGDIEEVIVRGTVPPRRTIEQKRPYEFVRDYDHDRYGLIIYLGKRENVPLRLYLNAEQAGPGHTSVP
jgi:hypothetical protein